MATDPDGDIVDHLDTNVAWLTKATNLFASKEMPVDDVVPDAAVFVLPSGGPAPLAYCEGGGTAERRFSGVQVITRSPTDDYYTGKTRARGIRNTLHHASISGYDDVRVNESEPLYLGENEARQHRWSTNVELWHEE